MRVSRLLPMLAFAVTVAQASAAEPWPVPAEAAAKANPVVLSPAVLEQGKALYATHCLDCHGASGAGDGDGAALLGIEIEALTSPAVKEQSDGALFYKTAEGRANMPGYITKKVLSEEEVWVLVHYMRSLAAQ